MRHFRSRLANLRGEPREFLLNSSILLPQDNEGDDQSCEDYRGREGAERSERRPDISWRPWRNCAGKQSDTIISQPGFAIFCPHAGEYSLTDLCRRLKRIGIEGEQGCRLFPPTHLQTAIGAAFKMSVQRA